MAAAAFTVMPVRVVVVVPMGMIVGMGMCGGVVVVMQGVDALGQGLVLGKAGIMAVAMPAAVGAGLGLEGCLYQRDLNPEAGQHVVQHGIVFELEVVGRDFDRDVAVAEMVSGTQQPERCVGRDAQHGLCGSLHGHEAAVIGEQHVSAPEHGATRQHERELAPGGIGGGEAAFLAGVPIEGDVRGAAHEGRSQSPATGQMLGYEEHEGMGVEMEAAGQNRK